ncbi:hypothetical protein TNIN_136041 [Trichonephila inaurata madagascariensis]|uniref:Uncharacterized protein n=1 Tax=Trichonephila inaurata madagascariensis TaxID=2747483 RepID=A0A8X6XC21_9ARAC|nr:hypothetical protein TNIN_136041 [Trichonephila inaurata madagascariensis]
MIEGKIVRKKAYNIELKPLKAMLKDDDCLASPREKYHEGRCFGTEGQSQPESHHLLHLCVFPRFDVKCIICNKRHYAVLCSKLPLRSGLETESASVENSTTAGSSSSNVWLIKLALLKILLRTLVVIVAKRKP